MITVRSIASGVEKKFSFTDFITQFQNWTEPSQRVFKNRLKENCNFEFEASIYEFEKNTYTCFKRYVGVATR